MTQRLTIGINDADPGWRMLLESIGLSWELITNWSEVGGDRYAAIIVAGDPGEDGCVALERYLAEGGGLLDAGHLLSRLEPSAIRRRHVEITAAADDEDPFARVGVIAIDRELPIHARARLLGGVAMLEERAGGHLAWLPLPAGVTELDNRSRRAPFSTGGEPSATEIVPVVTRGAIRAAFEVALRWLHEQRGLPLLRRPPVPGGGILCYRIDSDGGSREEVSALHEASREAGGRLTWFLHVEAHESWLDHFRDFDGDEIALHCYRHRTTREYEEDRENFELGLAHLRRAGFDVAGVAAPNGLWSIDLQRVIDDLGFAYSSELSIAVDGLPFHPWLRDRFARALQIPVHPICIGSLMRAHLDEEEMRRYFRSVIDAAVTRREPVMLYHHPGHRRAEVMADSIAYARSLGLDPWTMGEYAEWWNERQRLHWEGWLEGEEIRIRWKQPPPAIGLDAERLGEVAHLDVCERLPASTLAWEELPRPVVGTPVGRRARRGDRALIIRQGIEDFVARRGM